MRFLALVVSMAALAAGSIESMPAAVAAQTTVPSRLSLDDVLALESFGGAAFSPDGSRLAYERGASKSARPGAAYNRQIADQSVHIVALATGEQVEVRGPQAGVSYSLAPWDAAFSRDGRFLALRALSVESAGVAIWDTRTGTLRTLPGEMTHTHFHSAWTADGRYLYASAMPGEGMVSYPTFARRLHERWSEVWSGSSAQVLVMSTSPVVKQDEAPAERLLMARAETGEIVEIARGNYRRIVLSPDGRRFAAVRHGAATAQRTFGLGPGELQVFALTAAGADLEATFPDMDAAWQRLSWSPDARKLAVGGYAKNSVSEPARLHVYDTRTRKLVDAGLGDAAVNQFDTGTGFGVAPMGWLGSTPLAIGSPRAAEELPMAERERRMTDYGDRSRSDLWALTSRGPRKLTEFAQGSTLTFADPDAAPSVFVVVDGALWSLRADRPAERVTPSDGPRVLGFFVASRFVPEARQSFAQTASAGTQHPSVQLLVERAGMSRRVVFDMQSRRFENVPEGRVLAMSSDHRRTLLLNRQGDAQVLSVADGAAVREIARVNEFLNARAAGEIVPLDYSVAGREVRSWIVLPPGRDHSVPLPAVLWVYGGQVWGSTDDPPAAARLDGQLPISSGQLMAAQGYAMIYPSLPIKPAAEADVPALLAEGAVAAIDAAVAKGFVDPNRVAVTGHSFGGFSAAAILSRRSDRFRAGIAYSGVYDFIASYGSNTLKYSLSGKPVFWRDSMDYVENIQANLRLPPWQALEAYIRNSPFFSVEQIDAPLMIMQDDLDFDVSSLYGAERMYAALVRAGKKAALVHYWGEGHVPASVPNIRDQWGRVLSWLDAHLRE